MWSEVIKIVALIGLLFIASSSSLIHPSTPHCSFLSIWFYRDVEVLWHFSNTFCKAFGSSLTFTVKEHCELDWGDRFQVTLSILCAACLSGLCSRVAEIQKWNNWRMHSFTLKQKEMKQKKKEKNVKNIKKACDLKITEIINQIHLWLLLLVQDRVKACLNTRHCDLPKQYIAS